MSGGIGSYRESAKHQTGSACQRYQQISGVQIHMMPAGTSAVFLSNH
jgi:hypothetical protein